MDPVFSILCSVCLLKCHDLPGFFYATQSVWSAAAGVAAALVLAFFGRSLITVAAGACLAVFLAEQLMAFL